MSQESYLFYWEYKVDAMGFFQMPRTYKAYTELNKYARFTGFLKEAVTEFIKTPEEEDVEARALDIDRELFPENWWDTAIRIAKNQEVRAPLPSVKNITDKEKNVIHSRLIPPYRALRESFDRRPWSHWITHHSKYTAERDSIKALEGLMMSLVDDTQEDIEQALADHRTKVPASTVPAENRKIMIRSQEKSSIETIKVVRKYPEQNIPKKDSASDKKPSSDNPYALNMYDFLKATNLAPSTPIIIDSDNNVFIPEEDINDNDMSAIQPPIPSETPSEIGSLEDDINILTHSSNSLH